MPCHGIMVSELIEKKTLLLFNTFDSHKMLRTSGLVPDS